MFLKKKKSNINCLTETTSGNCCKVFLGKNQKWQHWKPAAQFERKIPPNTSSQIFKPLPLEFWRQDNYELGRKWKMGEDGNFTKGDEEEVELLILTRDDRGTATENVVEPDHSKILMSAPFLALSVEEGEIRKQDTDECNLSSFTIQPQNKMAAQMKITERVSYQSVFGPRVRKTTIGLRVILVISYYYYLYEKLKGWKKPQRRPLEKPEKGMVNIADSEVHFALFTHNLTLRTI